MSADLNCFYDCGLDQIGNNMAIDDHSSLAFEFILQSSALNEKLLSRQSKTVPGDHAIKMLLLGWLSVMMSRLAEMSEDLTFITRGIK